MTRRQARLGKALATLSIEAPAVMARRGIALTAPGSAGSAAAAAETWRMIGEKPLAALESWVGLQAGLFALQQRMLQRCWSGLAAGDPAALARAMPGPDDAIELAGRALRPWQRRVSGNARRLRASTRR